MRVEHDGRYLVVASKGGHPEPPAWYWNVRKNPHVELQDGAVKRDYLARELAGDERAEWWERALEVWPDYDTYQTKTDRLIAVFLLEPIDGLRRRDAAAAASRLSTVRQPSIVSTGPRAK